MSRLAIATYDLHEPYNYTAANVVMVNAGFRRHMQSRTGKDCQLTNTTWVKDVVGHDSAQVSDQLLALLGARFSAVGLNAKIWVIVVDDWAWAMQEVSATKPSLYAGLLGRL